MTDRRAAARTRMSKKRERDRAAGIIETTVKVPASRVCEIRWIAKQMREEADTANQNQEEMP